MSNILSAGSCACAVTDTRVDLQRNTTKRNAMSDDDDDGDDIDGGGGGGGGVSGGGGGSAAWKPLNRVQLKKARYEASAYVREYISSIKWGQGLPPPLVRCSFCESCAAAPMVED
jgi:hypothetical protein